MTSEKEDSATSQTWRGEQEEPGMVFGAGGRTVSFLTQHVVQGYKRSRANPGSICASAQQITLRELSSSGNALKWWRQTACARNTREPGRKAAQRDKSRTGPWREGPVFCYRWHAWRACSKDVNKGVVRKPFRRSTLSSSVQPQEEFMKPQR